MTRKEFSLFCAALRTYYPKEKILPNEQAMELWFDMLNDIPYSTAVATLKAWVSTNEWSPTIADIRASAAEVAHGVIPDWGFAWEKVIRAINNYGAYRAEEAMDSLDELTRTCVGRLGFTNLCMSENLSVERANFRIVYEQLAERKKQEKQMPEKLLKAIEAIQAKGIAQLEANDGNI